MTHETIWYKNVEIQIKKVKSRYHYRINNGEWTYPPTPKNYRTKKGTLRVAKGYIDDIYLRPLPIGPYMGRWTRSKIRR